jgi:hypothetical protein
MNPRDLIAGIESAPVLPPGREERFAGYGVWGLPFSSGHYLALRRFPASSLGPYTSVWWRDPAGHWVIYANASPANSCPRYYGRALERAEMADIDLSWPTAWTLRVRIPNVLDWEVELGSTLVTRLLNVVGGAAPRWFWRNRLALAAVARLAGPMLGTGKMRLQGSVPNGQSFQGNAQLGWVITASRASIQGEDVGPPGALDRQTHLADMWLPQRGLFFVGEAYMEAFDAARHWSPARWESGESLALRSRF